MHGEELEIKQEPVSHQALVIPEANELGIQHPEEENRRKIESKRRKVSVKTASGIFQCNICETNYGEKGTLNKHFTTVHEGRKQFKCDICNSNF